MVLEANMLMMRPEVQEVFRAMEREEKEAGSGSKQQRGQQRGQQREIYPFRHDGDDTAQLAERSTTVARTGSAIVAAANARKR